MERDEAIRRIKTALKKRSGRTWSVRGDRGTAWGWITITSPPARRGGDPYGYMSDEDRKLLGQLLGLHRPVHCQGQDIAPESAARREYVARAEGSFTA